MRSQPLRLAALGAVVALILAAVGLAGCGSSRPRAVARPKAPPAAITADRWKAPPVTGPPGTAEFCALLIADFNHVRTNPLAATAAIRGRIVGDFIAFTPKVVAAAPAPVAAAAATYLDSLREVLHELASAGFDPARLPPGAVGNILFSSRFEVAEQQVDAFAEQNCHYDLTSNAA